MFLKITDDDKNKIEFISKTKAYFNGLRGVLDRIESDFDSQHEEILERAAICSTCLILCLDQFAIVIETMNGEKETSH